MTNGISRRNFLQTGALAAGCAVAGAVPATAEAVPESGKPAPIKLGLASYTFRNFTRAQTIGAMQELGLRDINCKDAKDHLPMDAAGEATALADYAANGIKLHAVGTVSFTKDEDDDIRAKFEYAKRAGVKVIVAGDPAPATLPRLEKFVQEYDIRIAIHNHGPEDKLYPSPYDVLKAVGNMDPRMGCCIDIGHACRAGANVPQAIRDAGPRLFDMHAKDLTDFSNKESQVAVGEGLMPMRAIFASLIAIDYQGFVDLEYEIHADDPMPGVIESFAFMRGVLRGMGYVNAAS
ncbi:MAG TPA: sugar phosphate isomerase/epimerase [Terracidiphilus sp.]|nr:sugar phosphate isomerase/epimerase [Terracidiphilus sp.]